MNVKPNERKDERRPDEPLPVDESSADATGKPKGQPPSRPDQRDRALPGAPVQPLEPGDEKQGYGGAQS